MVANMMKRLSAILAASLWALAVWAQPSIHVEVHNIVELSERFNVIFVVEGQHSPSDFEWDAGDDFTIVWGPQKGTSSSIQIINGKANRSSQTSYTYILQAYLGLDSYLILLLFLKGAHEVHIAHTLPQKLDISLLRLHADV